MELPLQITFRDMEASPAVEASIRERMAKLDRFFPTIMSCRVVVEQEHRHHNKGNLFRVGIDLKVPEGEFVANRTPGQNHAHEDVFVAVRDAFDAMKKQLEGHVARRRGEVKVHEEPRSYGRVMSIDLNAGCGFIETLDKREIYFHKNSIIGVTLEKLHEGAEVRFSEEMGEKGPQASTVYVVGRNHAPG